MLALQTRDILLRKIRYNLATARFRYDINLVAVRQHIEPQGISSEKHISKIPQGFISLQSVMTLCKEGVFYLN